MKQFDVGEQIFRTLRHKIGGYKQTLSVTRSTKHVFQLRRVFHVLVRRSCRGQESSLLGTRRITGISCSSLREAKPTKRKKRVSFLGIGQMIGRELPGSDLSDTSGVRTMRPVCTGRSGGDPGTGEGEPRSDPAGMTQESRSWSNGAG